MDASGTISGKFREISGSQQGVILASFCASFLHQQISGNLYCFGAPSGFAFELCFVDHFDVIFYHLPVNSAAFFEDKMKPRWQPE